MRKGNDFGLILLLVLAYFLLFSGNNVSPSGQVTAVTYVYEKDDGGVPGFVGATLDRLNRRVPPILATPFEDDTKDASGEVPDQYKVALEAAQKVGSNAVVVQAGDKVLKVIKPPTVEAMEALK